MSRYGHGLIVHVYIHMTIMNIDIYIYMYASMYTCGRVLLWFGESGYVSLGA